MRRLISTLLLFCCSIASAQNDSTRRVHFGFIYPISNNGQYAPLFSNDVSFHLLAGVSATEKNFCFSGITNIIAYNAKGFVFSGIVNFIGGDVTGFEFAGLSNDNSGALRGCQLAGSNNIATTVNGCQLAGLSNITRNSLRGIQAAGVFNLTKDTLNGCQLSGFINIAKKIKGAQIAGFNNIAKNIKGTQIAGFSNVAKDVEGTQIAGFINIAKKVSGVQIAGFINIADSCAYPIGIINIIRNGDKSVGLSIDETKTSLLTFRSGSKKLYGILGLGYNLNEAALKYGLEAGMGARFSSTNTLFWLNVEASIISLSNFDKGVYMKSSLRIFPSIRIAQHFELFGGPTFSFINTPKNWSNGFDISYVWRRYSRGNSYGINIGAIAGVQYHF